MGARATGAASTPCTLAALLALLAVPWSIQTFAVGDVTFLFPWGLLNTSPLQVTDLHVFLFEHTVGLPGFILAWPMSVLLYATAVGSAALGVARGREDPRVTGGLLVLAGVAQLSVAWGFSIQPGRIAYPTGTVALWGAAWWYWSRVRRLRSGGPRSGRPRS